MLKEVYPYYLGSEAVYANTDLAVHDKYSQDLACRVALAVEDVIEQAITKAVDASEAMRKFAAYQRRDVLEYCVEQFRARSEELAYSLCVEAGKPIKEFIEEIEELIETRSTLLLAEAVFNFDAINKS